jgi:multidrug efflux pump subunit AcrA (membrane-fusion protein)
MYVSRLKIVTLVLLVVGLLAAGTVLTRPGAEAAPTGEARQDPPPGDREKNKEVKTDQEGPFTVEVTKPQQGGLARTTTQRCTVQARDRADFYPQVSGFLKSLKVDIGDHVKKGLVLAEVDAPLLALEEKIAASALKQAKGQVREAEARILAAKAEVQLARGSIEQKKTELQSAKASMTYQQRQYERMQELVKIGSVDQRLLDERKDQLDAARAKADLATVSLENAKVDVEVKQTRLIQAEAALDTARSKVESAELGVEKAQILHSLAQIRAPFDGVVTRRNVNLGEYVRAGEQGGQLPMFTVEGTERMRVITGIPDRDAPFVEPGLPVEVTVDALPNLRIPAKVSRTSAALTETNRTMMRVEIDIPNPKGRLLPGLTGEAKIQLPKRAEAMRVPASALSPTIGNSARGIGYVYVVRDGKAHRTRVITGANDGQQVEILSGLRATDLVVLRPGEWADTVPVTVRKGGGSK